MAEPLLRISGLTAGYGSATILHGIDLSMGTEAVAVLGRNGMGKSTFCNTLMGLVPARSGSVVFAEEELVGKRPHQIAALGIGYVPQGRRLFPSLSVEEHLAMLAPSARGRRWTLESVYELFPSLAVRRKVGAGELSGGEQQMLAIGRALLLNASLIIMDEPSEGLAPTIVDQLIDTCHHLIDEGIAILLVEQSLGVATAIASRQLIMVSGTIAVEMGAEELLNDPVAQRRYLGVDTIEEAS